MTMDEPVVSAMETITTALTSGLTSIQGDILGVIAAVLPIALVLFGARYAIGWAKRVFFAAA